MLGFLLVPFKGQSKGGPLEKRPEPRVTRRQGGVFSFISVDCGLRVGDREACELASPFFPGILLSRKPPKRLGKQLVFEKSDG